MNRNNIGQTVVFNHKIEEFDDYADEGMKACIIGIRYYSKTGIIIKFNFSMFREHNKNFEKPTFYNNSQPYMTATEADTVETIGDYYFDSEPENYFTIQ